MDSFQFKNATAEYKNAAVIESYGGKPVDDSLIKSIQENENVDKVIPAVLKYKLKYDIPGSSDHASIALVRESDRDYFMKREGIKLVQGRMPKDGAKEIVLNANIAKNRKVKIGDKVGNNINNFDTLPDEYEVVGLLDGRTMTSIVSANESIWPGYENKNDLSKCDFYIFPKQDRKSGMDNYLKGLDDKNIEALTTDSVIKDYNASRGALKVIDVIAILSIIVMVVTVGSSKYAQYLNRKEELGVLNAIGYNKNQILKKVLKEVAVENILGFGFGLLLGFIGSLFLAENLWQPCGVPGVLFTLKGFEVGIFIPLFTILFTIVPVNNVISGMDAIKIIEKN